MKNLKIYFIFFLGICQLQVNCQVAKCKYSLFNNFQAIPLTDVTSQTTNSTLGTYWNLSLTATGSPQIFQIELTSDKIPGAFYWSQDQIYPTVYVLTNCSASCNYNASQNVSESNYCQKTPNDTTTAWSLTTDQNISAASCFLQFYLNSSNPTNQTFNFLYYPEFSLAWGGQTEAQFNWSPYLYRYFKYNFPANYSQIANAKFFFYLSLTSNTTMFYFGTTETSFYCNYVFPTSATNCQNVNVTRLDGTVFSMEFAQANSNIYISVASNISNPLNFTIIPAYSCYTGYYKPYTKNTCVLIPPCSTGQYFNQNTGVCTECSKTLSNCQICTSSTVCSECINNQYILSNNKCKAICESGQYYNTASNTCSSCISNCLSCTSSTDCSQCYEPTYEWSSTKKACLSVCSGDGQYYNEQSSKCINCEVQNCVVCYVSGQQCSVCQDGYEINKLLDGNIECKKKNAMKQLWSLLCLLVVLVILI